MKRIIIIFFLLTSCSHNVTKNNNDLTNINYSDDLTLEEFRIKLDKYSNKTPYPNIND